MVSRSPSRARRRIRSVRLTAAVLTLLVAASVLVTRSDPAPSPDIRHYDLLTLKDLGPRWARVAPASVPTTEDPGVPEHLNAPCHRNQRIRLAFRQQVEESAQLPRPPATLPASSAVFARGGDHVYEISVRAARLPAQDIDRLERSLVESPRVCDGQVVPSSEGDPYGQTLHESAQAAPALGDHTVALRRTFTAGGSADWPDGGESLYLIREGNYAALVAFQYVNANRAPRVEDALIQRALGRAAGRLHRLDS